MRLLILLFCLLNCFNVRSQPQYPRSLSVNIDSLLAIAAKTKTLTDTINATKAMQQIDAALLQYRDQFPLYTGIIKLYQAVYHPSVNARNTYLDDANRLVSANYRWMADSFPYQSTQLINRFARRKRLNEWLPFDSLLRLSAAIKTVSKNSASVIADHAYEVYKKEGYYIAADLSAYNMAYKDVMGIDDPGSSPQHAYDLWMTLKPQYDQWKNTDYYKRDEELSFKKSFEEITWELRFIIDGSDTREAFVQFDRPSRTKYYRLYKDVLLHLADWTIQDHREGRAVVPLKSFIFYNLVPHELERINTDKSYQPVISLDDFTQLVLTLSTLYQRLGNGSDANDVLSRAIDFIKEYPPYWNNISTESLNNLFLQQARAAGMAGRFESAYRGFSRLKKVWTKPVAITSIDPWLLYMNVRLAEIETLIANNKAPAAKDSTVRLLEDLAPIGNDSVSLLYDTRQWPHLEYLGGWASGVKGDWSNASYWVLDALRTMEQQNHWEDDAHYYPTQLLYLIAKYRNEKYIMKNVVANLLFYTGRHLEHSFLQLTPGERMVLYDQQLRKYFDVYHELLFSHALDSFPALKKSALAQSLYLKNALTDGILLPDSVLSQAGDSERQKLVDDIRANRNATQLTLNRLRMRQENAYINSDMQKAIWLSLLELAETDTLQRLHPWETIAERLHAGEVYIEVVRYTNWLSDSTDHYGAYIMAGNKLQLVNLVREDSLLALLKDASASPQNAALDANNVRGLTIKGKPKKQSGFIPGSEDRLGKIILQNLWPYLQNKKTLIIVPDGMLNRISLAALQWKGKYLFEYLQLRQLSSNTAVLAAADSFPLAGKALLAGGLHYGTVTSSRNINRLFNKDVTWNYLPGTLQESQQLAPIFSENGYAVTQVSKTGFSDSVASLILPSYNIIHLATHGFYADSTLAAKMYDFSHWNAEAIQQEPLFRSGIALSNANEPDATSLTSEGYLMGYELAYTNLRNCYLVCLSACETGLGDLRNNLGVDGLARALKLGGARYLLTSLWKVPDAPTAVFMETFYKELFRLRSPHLALQQTRRYMSSKFNAVDWAAFVLTE